MSDGLENVVAAETVLSEVDGAAGRLIIRGRSLDDLAGRARFEDAVSLQFPTESRQPGIRRVSVPGGGDLFERVGWPERGRQLQLHQQQQRRPLRERDTEAPIRAVLRQQFEAAPIELLHCGDVDPLGVMACPGLSGAIA